MPVFNREHYVCEAIASVLSQDFKDFELLVVDDGSTDGSIAAVQRFDDPRIRVEANGRNRGIPFTRNRCLELARGDYVALLDSDDRMAPRRLARQVAHLDRNPDIATLGGWVAKFDGSGRTIKRLIKPLVPEELQAWLLFRCCHANTTLMGRTAILRDYGYREAFNVSEDYDLSVRIAEKHRVANLPYFLTYMREHEGRITNSGTDRSLSTKTTLAEYQLGRLGLTAEAGDLERHFGLTRLQRADCAQPDFLTWTAQWLGRIAAANAATRRHDGKALAGVLSLVWAQACLKAARSKADGAFAHYRGSPLRKGLGGMAARNLAAAFRA